jgi:hypothetical protein
MNTTHVLINEKKAEGHHRRVGGGNSLWVLSYLGLVTLLLYSSLFHRAYDDPFITYRYAENISRGFGFIYNLGERVLSTTTPLFAILLAGLRMLWSDLPHLANLIGAFSLALGGVFLWSLARSLQTPWVGWAGLLLFPTFPLVLSTLGSETPLYIALGLGAFAFYVRRQYAWTAFFAGLVVLCRLDGALVPLILATDYLIRQRADVPSGQHTSVTFPLLLFCLIVFAWVLFAWSYFGSPIPVTLVAKQHQGLMAISQKFAPGFITTIKPYAQRGQYWLEAALAVTGLLFLLWRVRRWVLFLSWPMLYFAVYSYLGVTRYFWYYAPLVPAFVVLVGLGLEAFGTLHGKHDKRNILRYVAMCVLFIPVIFQVRGLWRLRQNPDQRYGIYRALGEWLEINTPPQASVGALEVGIIGYYAKRPMVDFAGLIQPEVARQLTENATYEDAALWATEYYHPDYLVLFSGEYPRLEAGYVAEYCQLIRTFEGRDYAYALDLAVYNCSK